MKKHPTRPQQKKHPAQNRHPQKIARSGEHNERQVIRAMQRHSYSPLGMLNRGERKQVQEFMSAELAQGFEHRKRALSMALETRLQSIKEACNHVMVTGKTELRQQRIEYFGQVFSQVQQRMDELSDNFLLDMDERFERLGKFKNPVIKERESKRLEKSVTDFLDTVDELMDEFRSIIHENIGAEETSRPEQDSSADYGTEAPDDDPYTVADYNDEIPDLAHDFMHVGLRNRGGPRDEE